MDIGAVSAPQRAVPGLRPVPDMVDIACLPSVEGISDKDIKSALRGEFHYMDTFLGSGYAPVEENRLEHSYNDGRSNIKSRTLERK